MTRTVFSRPGPLHDISNSSRYCSSCTTTLFAAVRLPYIPKAEKAFESPGRFPRSQHSERGQYSAITIICLFVSSSRALTVFLTHIHTKAHFPSLFPLPACNIYFCFSGAQAVRTSVVLALWSLAGLLHRGLFLIRVPHPPVRPPSLVCCFFPQIINTPPLSSVPQPFACSLHIQGKLGKLSSEWKTLADLFITQQILWAPGKFRNLSHILLPAHLSPGNDRKISYPHS